MAFLPQQVALTVWDGRQGGATGANLSPQAASLVRQPLGLSPRFAPSASRPPSPSQTACRFTQTLINNAARSTMRLAVRGQPWPLTGR